jgi:hypothetical protein
LSQLLFEFRVVTIIPLLLIILTATVKKEENLCPSCVSLVFRVVCIGQNKSFGKKTKQKNLGVYSLPALLYELCQESRVGYSVKK